MPEEILTDDPVAAPVPVPHHRRRSSASTCGTIDVIDLGDGTCLVVYATDADPATMALVIGGAAGSALERAAAPDRASEGAQLMGRKILFVTTDQQRYDTLGCNGGTLARTPVVDGLAAAGHPLRAGRTRSRWCACRRARRCSPASTRAPTACG